MKQNGKKMVANMSRFQKIRMVPVLLVISLVVSVNISLAAEQKSPVQKSKKPPLLVTTVEVNEGAIQAMADFVGTTYFARVSHVATDIEGLVRKTDFVEGQKVKKGEPLVQLDSELLDSENNRCQGGF